LRNGFHWIALVWILIGKGKSMFSRGVEGVASLIGTGKMECQEIEKKMPILETAWDSGISVS